MTTRWYRSRMFWFGVPGFLLLLWMWVGHMGTVSRATLNTLKSEYRVSWGNGEVGFSHVRSREWHSDNGMIYYLPDQDPGFRVIREPSNPAVMQILGEDFFRRRNSSGFVLDFWFILAAYTMYWLGALTFWQKRKQRLMAAAMAM
jgi:hypothetical protein